MALVDYHNPDEGQADKMRFFNSDFAKRAKMNSVPRAKGFAAVFIHDRQLARFELPVRQTLLKKNKLVLT